ncbi:MAG: hypothetical protein QM790_02035 [Nibricoccus sp.]
MKKSKRQPTILFALFVIFGFCLRAKEPEPAAEPAIVLPAFYVTTEIEGYDEEKGWKYCSLPGLEVLAQDNDAGLKDFLQEFLIFRTALDTVWPKAMTGGQVPAILVFCSDVPSYKKFFSKTKLENVQIPPGTGARLASFQGRPVA